MSLIILNVDEVRRTLSASGGAFVVHDKEVDLVRFAINSGFADIVLDGQVALRVMYQRPGESQVRAQTLTYYDTDGLRSYYDWHLLSADLAKNGSLTVALCILDISGGEVSEWHTTPCAVRVLSTIHTDDSDEADESITPTVAERVAVLESMIQRVASGAPIVVASASDMTDTSQIYVLSTDGNWYYYNGSAWVAGGEYGAVSTDTTLTQSGMPADAKKTGDEITAIKADLGDLSDLETESKTDLVSAINEAAQSGLSDAAKSALLACFDNVAWEGTDGSSYVDALRNALGLDIWTYDWNASSRLNPPGMTGYSFDFNDESGAVKVNQPDFTLNHENEFEFEIVCKFALWEGASNPYMSINYATGDGTKSIQIRPNNYTEIQDQKDKISYTLNWDSSTKQYTNYSQTVYRKYKILVEDGLFKFYIDDILITQQSYTNSDPTGTNTIRIVSAAHAANGYNMHIKSIRCRNISSN